MRMEAVQVAVEVAMQAGREQLARELLAHLATIHGDGQGTRDDIAHWVRVQLGEAKHSDRYHEVTVDAGDAA